MHCCVSGVLLFNIQCYELLPGLCVDAKSCVLPSGQPTVRMWCGGWQGLQLTLGILLQIYMYACRKPDCAVHMQCQPSSCPRRIPYFTGQTDGHSLTQPLADHASSGNRPKVCQAYCLS